MFCPTCQNPARRFGFNRNGSQRYRCAECGTFTDADTRPTDRRRLAPEKAVLRLRMLLEGVSVRSVERLTEVHRDTILHTMVEAGKNCQRFLETAIHRIHVEDVQADEIWGFVGCKERRKQQQGYGEEVGDAWCFVAIERGNKMVLAWHLGKRTPQDTAAFAAKLSDATRGRFQLSTDGYTPYRTAIPLVFGQNIDFAQLVKVYATPSQEGGQTRYSPGEVVDSYPVICMGEPDEGRICTSHAERANLTIRMTVRRMTRLTNAHSKKWDNHEAAMALYFAYYNYCRSHMTLNERMGYKCSPAMAAGLASHVWTVAELLSAAI
jgi:transposase-like protein/IS1 family transposase